MTVFGSLYAEGFGGKGANQAVMAALLGTPTSMVGAVGQDSIGERTRRNFESLGIDTSHLASKADVASGVAQITVGGDGQNVIIVVPGANLQLTVQEVEAARNEYSCKTRSFHRSRAPPCGSRARHLRAPVDL